MDKAIQPFNYNMATFDYIRFLMTAELCSNKRSEQ